MVRRAVALVVVVSGCLLLSSAAFAQEAPPPANPGPPAAQPGSEPQVTVPEPGGTAPAQPPPPPAAAPRYYPAAAAPVQITDTERRQPRQRRRIGLMIAGLGVFAGGYVGAVLSFLLSDVLYGGSSAIGPELVVPIAGPWLALGSTDWNSVPSSQRDSAQMTMVLQGGLQAVGAVLSIVGISAYVASGSGSAGATRTRNVSFQLGPTDGGAFGMVRGRF